MIDNLVERARAAMDGVTAGPWEVVGENFDDVRIVTTQAMPKAQHCYGDQTVVGSSEWTYLDDANARFIAASRDLVPAMADRIEELEANLAAAREENRWAWLDGAMDGNGGANYVKELKATALANRVAIMRLEANLAKAVNIATLALDALYEVQTYEQPDDPYSENALTMHELDAFDFNVEASRTTLAELTGGKDD